MLPSRHYALCVYIHVSVSEKGRREKFDWNTQFAM
jgi:hypothetical protein